MRKNNIKITLVIALLTGLSLFEVYSQKAEKKFQKKETVESKKDSLLIIEGIPAVQNTEVPDSNFTYENYGKFLKEVSDKSKFIVLPIDEFRKTTDSTKIVIGLRHDVDLDLTKALNLAEYEKSLGFRASYYILHTANYYLADPSNKAKHNENIIPVLKHMQNDLGSEIGWHNDLVTLQVVYNIDPVAFLKQELTWLRNNGLKITGSASHGSSYCRNYNYLNYYFFNECLIAPTGPGIYTNNVTIPVGSGSVAIKKGNFSDFDLEYEAYFIKYNKYFSDASITNGKRWDIGMLNVKDLQPGDRVEILLHPIYWRKKSQIADFRSFYIFGQNKSIINYTDTTITVILPVGHSKNNLISTFSLTPGAFTKCSGLAQVSGLTVNNFEKPLVYKVFSENRNDTKSWTVIVENAKPDESDINLK